MFLHTNTWKQKLNVFCTLLQSFPRITSHWTYSDDLEFVHFTQQLGTVVSWIFLSHLICHKLGVVMASVRILQYYSSEKESCQCPCWQFTVPLRSNKSFNSNSSPIWVFSIVKNLQPQGIKCSSMRRHLKTVGTKNVSLTGKNPSRVVGDKVRKERKCTTNCANYWTEEREKLNNI